MVLAVKVTELTATRGTESITYLQVVGGGVEFTVKRLGLGMIALVIESEVKIDRNYRVIETVVCASHPV